MAKKRETFKTKEGVAEYRIRVKPGKVSSVRIILCLIQEHDVKPYAAAPYRAPGQPIAFYSKLDPFSDAVIIGLWPTPDREYPITVVSDG